MSTASNDNAPYALRRRLLNDIGEIRKHPYPNVHLNIDDSDISNVCLVLTPDGSKPLHFTIWFPPDYPLRAPTIQIQSIVNHPNVFQNYICASMLNTDEGWTSAYTLKGVVIQLLSFFSSDRIEQMHRAGPVDLAEYRTRSKKGREVEDAFVCETCGFKSQRKFLGFGTSATHRKSGRKDRLWGKIVGRNGESQCGTKASKLLELPDELWLLVFVELDTADILALSKALPTVKGMINSYDFIRTQELQCFCLKKSFLETKLGVGVTINPNDMRGGFHSEFDLLSKEAFGDLGVRKSVQGVYFSAWLPLALSRRHWNSVRSDLDQSLDNLHQAANLGAAPKIDVLYSFMCNIVVQFSAESDRSRHNVDARSTLTHASEKAVEAYFSLFHLLLCVANERTAIISGANDMIARFLKGPRTKKHFPNLGLLLVAALISDRGITEDLSFEIIREAVVRNVVWMLDKKGANMPELSYLEPDTVSQYRLTKTFQASLTSYRLLMFMKLFSSTARVPGRTLVQLRDDLFDSHGAPPAGTSATMAQRIQQIRSIGNFPDFLRAMGLQGLPSKQEFSQFLKRTITDSQSVGYSVMPLSQSQAYMLRCHKEPSVGRSDEVTMSSSLYQWHDRGFGPGTFFPSKRNTDIRGRGGGRGGRGRRGG